MIKYVKCPRCKDSSKDYSKKDVFRCKACGNKSCGACAPNRSYSSTKYCPECYAYAEGSQSIFVKIGEKG